MKMRIKKMLMYKNAVKNPKSQLQKTPSKMDMDAKMKFQIIDPPIIFSIDDILNWNLSVKIPTNAKPGKNRSSDDS